MLLYLANSGVKTAISSPPLDTVISVTEKTDKYLSLLNCSSSSDFSLASASFFIPMTIGIIPINPIIHWGTANVSRTAKEEITTSKMIPRNCPITTLRTKRPGVINNNIKTKVSSILEATNAVTPMLKRAAKSVKLQICNN